MPIWLDFNNATTAGATASAYNSPTLATASALHQAILSNQTQNRWYSTSGFDDLTSWTTTTTPTAWRSLGRANQTATTSAISDIYYWIEDQDVDHIQYIALAQHRVVRTQERNAEQQREFEERLSRQRQEQARLAQERAAALARSKELLLTHLTPAQRETFEKRKWFLVEGGKSKQLYRIRDGSYSANVDVLEGMPGKVTHRLCCHLADSRVPLYDHLLAQKVWLESDEDAFLRQANRHAA